HERGNLRQIEIGVRAAVSAVACAERAAGNDVLLRDRIGNLTGVVRELVSAAHGCLSRAEPRYLPGEAEGRAEVVIVVRVPGCFRLRRIFADEFDGRLVAANSRPHPILEAVAGDAEDSPRPADSEWHQTVAVVGNAVVIPSQAEIERETALHF